MIFYDSRFRQRLNFEGLQWGSKSPTDIDCMIDFDGYTFFFIEAKYRDVLAPDGQIKALENIVNAINLGFRVAVAIIAWHDTPPEEDVMIAQCYVDQYYFNGKWHIPKQYKTVREIIEEFL